MGEFVRRRLGTVVVLGLLLVLFSANRIAVLVTDFWWFDERGFREVFSTLLSTRVLLGVVFTVILTALIAVNLFIARRLRPFFVPNSPQQAQIQRYREMADPYLPWLILAVAAVFGLTSGLALSASWETWLLFLNGGEVGIEDPQFGVDLGFYLFQLPFWSLLQSWLFTSLVLTGMLTAGAHYLLGGIRPEADTDKILPSVKAHLSILLALILAVRAWGYWLDRYDLLYSERGTVTGASYTDVNAELPALYLLIGVSVVAIALVLFALRREGFLLPGAAVGLLVVASIILQGAYPAVIQRVQVDPQELAREQEFIQRNLEATRAAYGLADVDRVPFSIRNDLDLDDVVDNDITFLNVRLWDPNVLETTYEQLQSLRPYYEFNSVATDRYEIDGELRQVMLATRELSELPETSDNWQNRHITFTHGFGIVASQVNTANNEGQPVFIAENIPVSGSDAVVPSEQSEIYFGEFADPIYNLVRTEEDELNFEDPNTQEQVLTEYDGEAGVAINSFLRRIAFALRFSDYNLVLTNLLRDDSRIIFNRQITERVRQVAPFLEFDSTPYPVVADGRVTWVIDAYTTSNGYPYSERQLLTMGNRQVPVNYVRNSVKATVDAYDGDVTLYRVEEDDPVLDAWEEVFPDLIAPMSEAGETADNFRYPQDLFRLQSDIYTSYHIQDAAAFFNRADEFDLPNDPAAAANASSGNGTAAVGDLAGGEQRLEPYYLLMKLPGEDTEEFVQIQPYLARNRPNMVSWLAGRSDGENLNELLQVRFPSDQQVLGPAQAQARIEQDDDISAYITLRSREGSDVVRGNLQVLPVADSILYVQPLFLENPQAQIPELARVALVMGERTAFDRTLAGALSQIIGVPVPDAIADDEAIDDPIDEDELDGDTDEGEPAEDEPEDPAQVSERLLREALAAFARAEDALREGNLASYQASVLEAQRLIEQAARSAGVSVDELINGEAEDNDEPSDAELLEELEEAEPQEPTEEDPDAEG